MALQWNGDQALLRARRAAAAALINCAVYFVKQHTDALNVSSPHTSVRRQATRISRKTGEIFAKGSRYLLYTAPAHAGEYPKYRTGAGRGSTWYEPRDIQGVLDAGDKIRIGYKPTLKEAVANHLLALEHKGFLGLQATLARTRPALVRIVATGKAA